jgi:hypothetical protein
MGSFGGIAEARDRDDSPPQHQDEGHSSGEVNTAAIVGAVIAKAT